MSENKWTPGPWETDRYAVRSEGPDGRQVALCEISVRGRPYEETYAEAEANASLISAAPDLARIVAIFLNGDERFQVSVGGNPVALERLFADAHAALAKARGEA